MKLFHGITIPLVALLVAACSSTSTLDNRTEQLRAEFDMLSEQGALQEHAAIEGQKARDELERLEEMVDDNADESEIQQQLYMVERQIDVVRETMQMQQADAVIDSADSDRKDVIISQREEELREAESRADMMEVAASNAEQMLAEMQGQVEVLQEEVEDLSATETDRGMVLTLGDILFEVNESDLKNSSTSGINKVAEFLNNYPEREILIEGHTDSTGSAEYNQELSVARAESVKDALVSYGVDSDRIDTDGFGQDRPVADNDTDFGRTQNRRVEIVILDDQEDQASLQ